MESRSFVTKSVITLLLALTGCGSPVVEKGDTVIPVCETVGVMECDDNLCTVGDSVVCGECVPGEPIDCTDGDYCTLDICIEGECTSMIADEDECCEGDEDCSDWIYHTLDTCEDHHCVFSWTIKSECPDSHFIEVCADGNECTCNICHFASGCVVKILAPGVDCYGHDWTGGDHCCGNKWVEESREESCFVCHDYKWKNVEQLLDDGVMNPDSSGLCCGTDCDDGLECTLDWCDGDVCAHEPYPNGTKCKGELNWECQDGVCVEIPLDSVR